MPHPFALFWRERWETAKLNNPGIFDLSFQVRLLDARGATRYSLGMIRSFRHAGLEKFFFTGTKAGIQPAHAKKLSLQLGTLNISRDAMRMSVPGWNLHSLKGDLVNHWSVKVNGNWRMTFAFDGEDAIPVDYQDYHGR